MRGVYGKGRALIGAEGILSDAEGKRRWAERQTAPLLEQAKVAAVITLSAVAVIAAGKVLSPTKRRRF